MNTNVFVVIICAISLGLGAFLGIQIFKIKNRKIDKQLEKNAKEVLEGRRENKIIIDGQKFDATKFRVRAEDGSEKLIDFMKGGEAIQDGTRHKNTARVEEISRQEVEIIGENSDSRGEEKRTTRDRSILSRIRRFG